MLKMSFAVLMVSFMVGCASAPTDTVALSEAAVPDAALTVAKDNVVALAPDLALASVDAKVTEVPASGPVMMKAAYSSSAVTSTAMAVAAYTPSVATSGVAIASAANSCAADFCPLSNLKRKKDVN